jgi:hypothetical protein
MGNNVSVSDFLYNLKCYAFYPLFAAGGGPAAGLQDIDGYLYYPSFICPTKQIAHARTKEWVQGDLVGSSYPKSGTHFLQLTTLLIGFKGELPPRADIHSLCSSLEFQHGEKGNHSRFLEEPKEDYPTNPRVCMTHMPHHHLRISDTGRFVYVMREPVATLASLRRMQYLLFGPIMNPTLADFIKFQLFTRPTGWLDHVLGWWSVRDKPNVLVLTYEMMVQQPERAVRQLAAHMEVQLTDEQVATVVTKMDKKWALANVDPYLYAAKTPFSPPDRGNQSKSGFIVDTATIKEKLSATQETEIRDEYTRKIRVIMDNAQDPVAAANAKSFFESNRSYFSS